MPDPSERAVLSDQGSPAVAYIAKCAEHGLHGERDECFVCGEPCAQIGYVRADQYTRLLSLIKNTERERDRLRAENKALKGSWEVDAQHRDDLYGSIQTALGLFDSGDPVNAMIVLGSCVASDENLDGGTDGHSR